MIVIITEKPSARRNFEKALGGKQGSFNGEEYKLVNSVGHIMQFPKDITKLISDKDKHDKYKTWDIRNLPFSYEDFRFIKEISKSSDGKSLKSVYDDIKSNCLKASEIVIASDDDPSGEGTLLVAEILLTFYNDIKSKKISRMFFADESESEIQKAFINRVDIPDLLQDKDFIKSDYRSKWDYLSIQFTRIATTLIGGAVLRNGRLKSFMNTLVGDQIKRVNDYKKIPMYQQAFISDTGVWFLKKNNDVYKDSLEVPKIDGNDFNIIIKEKKEKYTAPGKLLDLAGLSAILESKGYKAKEILETYQHMYEDQIVSYPRTEDKVVTIEQYKEMLNIAPKIADVIGIDKSLLTHIEPRKQHIGNGSHGANRPGSNVPDNLDTLDSKYGKGAKDIYLILSKNYLSILGEDLKYEQTTACIDGYEDFVGTSKKVLDLGFKKIFKLDDDEEIEDKVIGSIANYKVKESFPKKPATPTMKWLKI